MTSASIPPTMKAWTFTRRGSPTTTLQLSTSFPTPSANALVPGDVLIRVSHVSLNIGLIVAFTLIPHLTSTPWIPELEFSGTIAALGPSANADWRVGDEVIGGRTGASMWAHNGCLAEYIVSPADQLIGKPAGVGMAEASGLVGVSCTSLQAMEIAGVKRGDKILITGGSGGLGSMLVQMCRAVVGETGYIVATCSGKNAEMVKGVGVDEVVDYTVERNLRAYCEKKHGQAPFDAIFDIVGDKALHTGCAAYLTENGYFVLLGEMSKAANPSWWGFLSWMVMSKLEQYRPVLLGGVPRNHVMHNTMPDQKSLVRMKGMIEKGEIKAMVDGVWKMEDAKEAYERSISQRSRGKVVIQVEE